MLIRRRAFRKRPCDHVSPYKNDQCHVGWHYDRFASAGKYSGGAHRALLCIRFTLLSQIEEDYREIGVMKAIGIRIAGMKQIYLIKYAILGGTGCLAGFLFSCCCGNRCWEVSGRTWGMREKAPSLWQPDSVALRSFWRLSLFFFVNRVLNRFRKITLPGHRLWL